MPRLVLGLAAFALLGTSACSTFEQGGDFFAIPMGSSDEAVRRISLDDTFRDRKPVGDAPGDEVRRLEVEVEMADGWSVLMMDATGRAWSQGETAVRDCWNASPGDAPFIKSCLGAQGWSGAVLSEPVSLVDGPFGPGAPTDLAMAGRIDPPPVAADRVEPVAEAAPVAAASGETVVAAAKPARPKSPPPPLAPPVEVRVAPVSKVPEPKRPPQKVAEAGPLPTLDELLAPPAGAAIERRGVRVVPIAD